MKSFISDKKTIFNYALKCYRCKKYLRHDSNFEYCKKYKTQSRGSDDCEVILKTLPS